MTVVADKQHQIWQVGCLHLLTLYQLKEWHMVNILLSYRWTYKKIIVVYFQILSWYLTRRREENQEILRQNIQFQEFLDPSPQRAKLLDTSPEVQNNFVISAAHFSGNTKLPKMELPKQMLMNRLT
jgi:hypothetical protein